MDNDLLRRKKFQPFVEDKNLNKIVETIVKMFGVLAKLQQIRLSFKPLKKTTHALVDAGRV